MESDEQRRWEYAVRIVLEHEGGLSDNKRDPGGITKWGISLRFLRAAGLDINNDGVINREDIIGISKPIAKDIYKKHWWNRYKYNDIKGLMPATKVFDLSVNMGASQAHKILQISINRALDKSIRVDGILGPITLSLTNDISPNELMNELRLNAAHFYKQLAADKPALKVFEKGWLNRAAW